MIHVFIGTKAQYIKTAPVLRALDRAGVPYRLIDSGQHARLTETLRPELGVRAPDYYLRQGENISRIGKGSWWMWRHLWRAWVAPERVRAEVFGGQGGICLIHGDTGSTLLAAFLARRAGLRVAHLEAGLRSGSVWDPFPEEVVRRIATHLSDILFAPSSWAVERLQHAKAGTAVVNMGLNTGAEAAALALSRGHHPLPEAQGYLLVTIHRLETLCRRGRLRFITEMIFRAARQRPVIVVLHEPTRLALRRYGLLEPLERAPQIRLLDLQPYEDFLHVVAQADGVITDGGSVQEECAYLGVPCLVLRDHTERPDGLGENALLVPFQADAVQRFMADPSPWRRSARLGSTQPSQIVLETLRRYAEETPPAPASGRQWGWTISLAVLAWLIWLIVREAQRVAVWPGLSAWRAWMAAMILQCVAMSWMAWWWARLAHVCGVTVPSRQLVHVWAQALPAKYVPGKWWQVAGRWYLAKEAGATAATAMMAIILEQAYILITCLLLLLLAWWTPAAGRVWNRMAGGSGWIAVIASVLTIPWWLPFGVQWAGRRMGLTLDVRSVPLKDMVVCGLGYLGYWMLSLAGLCWFVRGWPSVTWPMAVSMALTYVAAFLVGSLCPWAPAGLGVRESAFAWGIAPMVGTGAAAAIAVGTRLWFMVTDALVSLGLRWLTRPASAAVREATAEAQP